ncbi:MAG: alpha/beta hydrolase [Pseudomonadota bacterium]
MSDIIEEKEIQFRSGSIRLSGSLNRHQHRSPGPLCLLLSGSGPQDRDQTVCGIPTFKALAEALTDAGYAVFRWDDRGVGESDGDYLESNGQQLVDDAIAALDHLCKVCSFEAIHLIGHSQGTLVAPQVALKRPDLVKSLVLLAGMALPGRNTLLEQHAAVLRADNWPVDVIDASVAQKARVFDVLEGVPDTSLTPVETARLRAALTQALLDEMPVSALNQQQQAELNDSLDDLLEWEWRLLLKQDPARQLARISTPVLALFGDEDLQVNAIKHATALAEALPAGLPQSIQTLRGFNHLFQQSEGSPPLDYSQDGPAFPEAACRPIIDWLNRHS